MGGGGVPAIGTGPVQDFSDLDFRFLVAVDVEGFSQRHTAEQAEVQADLERAMTRAATGTGLDRRRWYRQPRGDGELAVLPAGADGLSLVADYPRRLAAAIADVNRERRGLRLRVRMAIHHGAVTRGAFGPVGMAPVVIARLLDAEIVRQQLRQQAGSDITLIVSATVYNEVIQSQLRDLHPEAFRRVTVRAKGLSYDGYLREDVSTPQTPVAVEAQRPPVSRPMPALRSGER
jgi:hypothetical protein